ncbi:hypothetical protein FB563_3920 [Streptomyces puniciscabiei]|uniref:Peptidase inhibitor family I36 n=1 Tax=Streptomyces puniciscabiei TaxID=164348 RepID=A0A542UII4_9ACTN|nr:hypothetical protein [Streptomyces puniciscabiei]TQK98872.1 hypothetical protein FB563_3920 [Streptomyces puniciscabiei]
MRFRIATAAVLTACAMAGSGLALTAPSASADTRTATGASAAARPSCPYPYVCFYNGNTMTGKFKDTGYWQKLGASRNAKGAVNTRHDDVAYVRFSNYHTICMKPGEGWAFGSAHPTYVYISKSSTCH